ncbi:hypothetical protein GCM10011316_12520 [Roseibium aquae]|uniref:Uncharacterized protein n=1 Tax=Roseibium aquae TaxID=1323746 RepID=A0A916TFH3_9HYPH|nr:hypothetical protein GCM10011316_12520 [Roseibium aquae]
MFMATGLMVEMAIRMAKDGTCRGALEASGELRGIYALTFGTEYPATSLRLIMARDISRNQF